MASMAGKRKRDTSDMPNPRAAPQMASSEFEDQYLHSDNHGMGHGDNDMAFALSQHNADAGDSNHQQHGLRRTLAQELQDAGSSNASNTAAAAMAQYHTMTIPQTTEQAFMSQPAESGNDGSDINGQDAQRASSFSDFDINAMKDNQAISNGQASPPLPGAQSQGGAKPQVGTDEWHKIRKDNHKEVERRRRETINEGINELAKIVPGCEKNKGSILARAVQFITQLKENETQNIEKWTLEKLLTEQAIAELSSSCDKLKAECQRAWAECEQWKKAATRAGISLDLDEKNDVDAD